MIQYFENFASGHLKKDIEKEILTSPQWLWQYRSETAGQYDTADFSWIEDENTEESPQLIHTVGDAVKDVQITSPLVYKIIDLVGFEPQFQRIKVNLLWPNALRKNPNSYHRPHADHGRADAKTLIYYVNDSDGDTVIFKNLWTGDNPGQLDIAKRITPKAGSAVLFDSRLYHASSSPTQGVRSVINFIFWPRQVDPLDLTGSAPQVPVNIPIGKGFNRI